MRQQGLVLVISYMALVLLAIPSQARGDLWLDPPEHLPAGGEPYSVTIADFNADGHGDMAVVDYTPQTVTVSLGNGDGTFQTGNVYTVGQSPVFVTTGLLNADQHLDVLVANSGSDDITVLLGNGDGTFVLGGTYASGHEGTVWIDIGDFNEDGYADLVATNYGDLYIGVLIGNGDGTFQSAVLYSGDASPWAVEVGDYNEDGHQDLAVANYWGYNVSIYLGVGDGTFGSPSYYPTSGTQSQSMATADLNGDDHVDLVVGNSTSNNISALLGNGNGTFQAPVIYPSGSTVRYVVIDDFNGDSASDLAVANSGDDNVMIFLGVGDGTFPSIMECEVGDLPMSLATGDVDGILGPDLLVANGNSDTYSVMLNTIGESAHVCCIAMTCYLMNEADCLAAGGDWYPEWDSCDRSDPCLEYVCCTDEQCDVMRQDECQAAGGDWLEGIATCDPDPCPEYVCCIGEQCYVYREDECLVAEGEWLVGVEGCDPDPCVRVFNYSFAEDLAFEQGQQNAEIYVYGMNEEALKGYTINFIYDSEVFEYVGMSVEGTRGEGAEILIPAWTDSTAHAAVIYSYDCPPQIDEGTGSLLKVIVNVKDDAPLGLTALDLEDLSPAVNRVTTCDGAVQTPELLDATNVMITPNCTDYVYHFGTEPLWATADSTLDLVVHATNVEPMKGYSIHLNFDPAVFECTGLSLEGTCGEDAIIFIDEWGGGFARAGVVYSYSCPPEIPAGDSPALKVTLHVKSDAPYGYTALDLEDSPPAYNRITLCDGQTKTPCLLDGRMFIHMDASEVDESVETFGFQEHTLALTARPNPINGGMTNIVYQLPHGGEASLAIFDMSGRMIRLLTAGNQVAGVRQIIWDGDDAGGRPVGSGSYFVRLRQGSETVRRQVLMIR